MVQAEVDATRITAALLVPSQEADADRFFMVLSFVQPASRGAEPLVAPLCILCILAQRLPQAMEEL